MAIDYTSQEGDFTINVSLPLNQGNANSDAESYQPGDNVPIQGVEANTEYPLNVITTFDGKAYIPGLPQVQFQVSLMYLDTSPSHPVVDDTSNPALDDNNVLGSMHRDIEIGEHRFDGAYDQIAIHSQELDDQGTMAMIVQPRFTYVGTRAANCA